MMRHFLEALATFLGVTIAAGIFAIPYGISKSGILIGVLEILVLAFLITILYLYYGEIVLRTESKHQLSGYAEKYTGKNAKYITMGAMIIGLYGVLSAFLIGGSEAIGKLMSINNTHAGILFFVGIGLLIGIGLKAIEKSEIITNGIKLVLFILLVIFVLSVGKINFDNYKYIEIKNMFVPYGLILFAFFSIHVIPEMREELSNNARDLKRAIIYGSIIATAVYVIFTVMIIGVSGINTSDIATTGIENLSYPVFLVGNLFFILALTGAFLATGLALKEMFMYDLKLSAFLAWVFTLTVPFLIFYFKLSNFISLLDFVGIIIGGILGILIVLIHHNAKKLGTRKPEYDIKEIKLLNVVLISIFILGIIYYILEFIG